MCRRRHVSDVVRSSVVMRVTCHLPTIFPCSTCFALLFFTLLCPRIHTPACKKTTNPNPERLINTPARFQRKLPDFIFIFWHCFHCAIVLLVYLLCRFATAEDGRDGRMRFELIRMRTPTPSHATNTCTNDIRELSLAAVIHVHVTKQVKYSKVK